MISPGIARTLRLFENYVLTALLAQIIAQRKPCLPSANNDGVHVVSHSGARQCGVYLVTSLAASWAFLLLF